MMSIKTMAATPACKRLNMKQLFLFNKTKQNETTSLMNVCNIYIGFGLVFGSPNQPPLFCFNMLQSQHRAMQSSLTDYDIAKRLNLLYTLKYVAHFMYERIFFISITMHECSYKSVMYDPKKYSGLLFFCIRTNDKYFRTEAVP